MANTPLPCSSLSEIHNALHYAKAMPINNVNGKHHTHKQAYCLTSYLGFISREWFLIAWGRTQTHISTSNSRNQQRAAGKCLCYIKTYLI